MVILEPDGLGIIPWYNPFADRDTWVTNPNYEWCQPAEADQATAAADRFAMLNYAVDELKAHPSTSVYLDGTHSAWLGSGDAADRLIQAGVGDADGFFLNVSNYRLDAHLEKYGTWTSKCIAFASNPASWGVGHAEWCASQYFPANPNDFSTWGLTDQWYTDNVESQTWWYSESVLKHFVVDTSRNGQGPWTPPAYPDPQDWCNPPDRGLGLRADRRHRQRPDRRLPLGQDPRRVRRRVHARPRAGGRDRGPGVGRHRSGRGRLVRRDGPRPGDEREPGRLSLGGAGIRGRLVP